MNPKLALCNIFPDIERLGDFAHDYGFSGIDWSFDLNRLPETPAEESRWANGLSSLSPLEIRFHCPFYQVDLGHNDPGEAKAAKAIFRRIIRLVSKAGGEYLTIHIGLGHNSTEPLSWNATLKNLREIVRFGAEHRVKICLENLAWGWTSRPNLFEKLIRRSGADVTFDIGHAHACESVRSQQYTIEDFITPHKGRVLNAHIYHTETSGLGHLPPERLEDIEARLDLLQGAGCRWWTIEIRESDTLIRTKELIDRYLACLDVKTQLGANGEDFLKLATSA
jgi:sugar phosphate isomerase/epimerase